MLSSEQWSRQRTWVTHPYSCEPPIQSRQRHRGFWLPTSDAERRGHCKHPVSNSWHIPSGSPQEQPVLQRSPTPEANMIALLLFSSFICRIEEGAKRHRKARAQGRFRHLGTIFADAVIGLYFTSLPSKMRAPTTPRRAFVNLDESDEIEQAKAAIEVMPWPHFCRMLNALGRSPRSFKRNASGEERLYDFEQQMKAHVPHMKWEAVIEVLRPPPALQGIKKPSGTPPKKSSTPVLPTDPSCVTALTDLRKSQTLLDRALGALDKLQKGCTLHSTSS